VRPQLLNRRIKGRHDVSRRNANDPLLQAFLDTYHVNLLSIPRQSADVGDAYVQDRSGAISPPGKLKFLLTPELQMPEIRRDEKLTNLSGKRTRAIDLDASLKLLDGFFGAIGIAASIGKIKAEFENKQASRVRFRLKSATRDSVDAFEFGKSLIPCKLNGRQPFVQPGNRYYAVTGVFRSQSITLHSEDENSNIVGLDVGALQNAIDVGGKIAVSSEAVGEATYTGLTPLAFGVELVEILYDDIEQKFFVAGIREAATVRAYKERRVLIGDAKTGSVFLPDPTLLAESWLAKEVPKD
jgi:hypothetical protein